MPSLFPEAVELRLRKISGSLAKDIVAAAQFTIFTFQLWHCCK
nr:Phage protein [Escherichia coli O25b:H4-ST131]